MNIYNDTPKSILLMLLKKMANSPEMAMTETSIMRATDHVYSHVVKTVNFLKKSGLVKKERKGRKSMISLTQRGCEVAELFNKIDRLMEKYD